jgi:hypothetical protein
MPFGPFVCRQEKKGMFVCGKLSLLLIAVLHAALCQIVAKVRYWFDCNIHNGRGGMPRDVKGTGGMPPFTFYLKTCLWIRNRSRRSL